MTGERTEDLLCHLYKVLCSDMPSCGCGWPQEANRLVWQVLALAPTYGAEPKKRLAELIGTEGARQIVLASIEKAGLIGHGTAIDSLWLEPRGRWVLWAVEQVGGIEGLDEKLESAGYPHSDVECTDACWVVPDGWGPTQVTAAVPPALVTVPCPGASCPQYLYGMPHEHTAG